MRWRAAALLRPSALKADFNALQAFNEMVMSVGQIMVFDFRSTNLVVTVKAIETLSLEKLQAITSRMCNWRVCARVASELH